MNNHRGQAVDAVAFVQQLDTSGELKIPESGVIEIKTRNSTYVYDVAARTMSGGVCGDEPVKANVHGTTFGGSMIKVGYLMPGGYMEFSNHKGTWTTSTIKSVEVKP